MSSDSVKVHFPDFFFTARNEFNIWICSRHDQCWRNVRHMTTVWCLTWSASCYLTLLHLYLLECVSQMQEKWLCKMNSYNQWPETCISTLQHMETYIFQERVQRISIDLQRVADLPDTGGITQYFEWQCRNECLIVRPNYIKRLVNLNSPKFFLLPPMCLAIQNCSLPRF